MKFTRLIPIAALLCGVAASAQARNNPTPKPSGKVVHLFGPNSIMGDIVPDLPGETSTPATAAPGGTAGVAAPVATASDGNQAAPTGPAAASPQTESTDPSVGAILHQMFVVGDPENPNKPAPGRAADNPQIGQ